MKEIVILGGPNGAGKTTAANVLLPEFLGTYKFLNADEIARWRCHRRRAICSQAGKGQRRLGA